MIDPNNIPQREDLKQYITNYRVFNKFEDHKKCFYIGVKGYITQFKDNNEGNNKGDEKGRYFHHDYFILLLLK